MAAKRCPMCHLVNRATADSCDCGYRFGADSPELPGMLAHQLALGWIIAVTGGAMVVAGVALWLAGVPGILWLTSAIGGGLVLARGIRKISRSRHSLRAIAKAKLPPARVVR